MAPAARTWHSIKLFAALKDMPETALLAGLVGTVVSLAGYTAYRINFTPAGGSFPSADVRHSIEKQLAVSEVKDHSVLYTVAEKNSSKEGGYDVSAPMWSNQTRPYEYNLPTPDQAHTGASPAAPTAPST